MYQIHLLSWKQSINWDRRVSAKLTQINRRKEKNYKYSISIIDNNENVKQNPLKSNKNKCFNYITSLIVRAFSMNHSNFLRSSFSPKLCFQTNWPRWENWNLVFALIDNLSTSVFKITILPIQCSIENLIIHSF